MFIFYYAVLSEVSPPTALSAFAAAAITGGDGFKTMMLTARYTLPAFLVPFAFVLIAERRGAAAAGRRSRRSRSPCAVSAVAVAGAGGRARRLAARPGRRCPRASWPAPAALVLLYLEPLWIAIGLGARSRVGLVTQLGRTVSRGGPHPARPDHGP